jgi:DNA-directed RNA polymerase
MHLGEAYPSIPPLHESLVLPPKPPDYDTNLQARMKWYNASKEAENEYRNHHSQRCDTNYKIEIARAVNIKYNAHYRLES